MSRVRMPRAVRAGMALGVMLGLLLTGCVSIPTGGGVTTTEIDGGSENPLVPLPEGPAVDASPADIVSGFIRAGRGPQNNYRVAREYLTDDFSSSWIPGARALISSSRIIPVALADNTWSVSIQSTAQVDARGHYLSGSTDTIELAFGLVQNGDGQWRISSAPEGIVLPPSSFAAIFAQYELYFFDPTFRFLVPDVRWFSTGAGGGQRLVSEMLAGPSEWAQGALVSAFPDGTEATGPQISAGVAVVDFSTNVSAESSAARRRMLQQLTETLRSLNSVREVSMTVGGFTLSVPGGGNVPDSRYLVGTSPIGGLDGRIGTLTEGGIVPLSGIGRSADGIADVRGGSVSRGHDSVALISPAGLTVARGGGEPAIIDGRSNLVAASLDPSGYVWSVSGAGGLLAIAPGGTQIEVAGLPEGEVISFDVARDGARVLIALATSSGPRLVVAGILRDGDAPERLVDPVVELPIGSEPILDAAWVNGTTVVALTGDLEGDDRAVSAYVIGGQRENLGSPVDGVAIVGGNELDGTRVLDAEGRVLRPGGGASWQDTGIRASFFLPQQ